MMPIAMAYDWVYSYRPAALALLAGQSPYTITSEKFCNAPWVLLLLIPLALLPDYLGWILLGIGSLFAFGWVAISLGATRPAALAFVSSPFVLSCLYYGQIDAFALLGLVMPPWIGLFFVAIKPQTCGLVAIYWLVEAWKSRTVIRTFAPVTLVMLLSFALFGLWPLKAVEFGQTNGLWPFSILISLALIALAFYRKDRSIAGAASPFVSPYFRPHSLSSSLLAMVRYPWLIVTVVAILWIVEVIR